MLPKLKFSLTISFNAIQFLDLYISKKTWSWRLWPPFNVYIFIFRLHILPSNMVHLVAKDTFIGITVIEAQILSGVNSSKSYSCYRKLLIKRLAAKCFPQSAIWAVKKINFSLHPHNFLPKQKGNEPVLSLWTLLCIFSLNVLTNFVILHGKSIKWWRPFFSIP